MQCLWFCFLWVVKPITEIFPCAVGNRVSYERIFYLSTYVLCVFTKKNFLKRMGALEWTTLHSNEHKFEFEIFIISKYCENEKKDKEKNWWREVWAPQKSKSVFEHNHEGDVHGIHENGCIWHFCFSTRLICSGWEPELIQIAFNCFLLSNSIGLSLLFVCRLSGQFQWFFPSVDNRHEWKFSQN